MNFTRNPCISLSLCTCYFLDFFFYTQAHFDFTFELSVHDLTEHLTMHAGAFAELAAPRRVPTSAPLKVPNRICSEHLRARNF